MYLTIFDLFAYISSIYIGKKDAVKQFTARFLRQLIKRAIQAFFNSSKKRDLSTLFE